MTSRGRLHLWFVVLLSLTLVILSHWFQDTTGLSVGDEGYLWYGTLRAAAGDVPIRDFRSYDPGRYYWCAAFSHLFGDGLIGLRRSSGVFELLGVLAGLLALTRVTRNWIVLALSGACLTLWMQPVYKLFEPTVAMIAIWVGVRLLEKPSRTRLFVAGIFVGLAAFVGRNLGLYCLLAFACLILYLRFKIRAVPLLSSSAVWVAGVVAGYSPMLVMIAFVPGFAGSFVESIVFLFTRGGMNIPLPVPWAWRADLSGSLVGTVLNLSKGIAFLMIPVFLGTGLILLLVVSGRRVSSANLLAACVFVGLFYSHHAFSRADFAHLSGAFHPILLGVVALTHVITGRRLGQTILAATFIVMTLPPALGALPAVHRLRVDEKRYVRTDIRGDSIWITRQHAFLLDGVQSVVKQHVLPDEGLLIAPHDTILYPILGRKVPVWDCYIYWPQPKEKQLEMIEQMEESNTQWALISSFAVDSRPDLSLRRALPVLWEYLMREFEFVTVSGLMPDRYFMRRKNRPEPGAEGEPPSGP